MEAAIVESVFVFEFTEELPIPNYKVIVEWRDDFVSDADEMQVIARSPAAALKATPKLWATKFGSKHPKCRATRCYVLTDKEMSAI